jgi:hypothetical protein
MSDLVDGKAKPASFPSSNHEKFLGGRGEDMLEVNSKKVGSVVTATPTVRMALSINY